MDFRITINGTEIKDHPTELNDWFERLVYDRALNILLLEYPSQLTFYGDGYDVLTQLYDELLYTGKTDVVMSSRDGATGIWKPVFDGVVFMCDLDFNHSRGTVKTELIDKTIGARIRNNFNVRGYCTSDSSKNGVAITPVSSLGIQLITQNSSGTYGTDRAGYDAFDVFTWLVQFITDNEMTAKSDYYDALSTDLTSTDLHKVCFMTGEEIKQKDSGFAPQLSFASVSRFLCNVYGLMMGVENDPTDGWVIRLEPETYFEDSETSATIKNIDEIYQRINRELLYSTITVGSNVYIRDENGVDGYPLPYLPTFSHSLEQYYIEGECNIDTTRDLSSEISMDVNAIHDLYTNNVDDYDDTVFAIEYGFALIGGYRAYRERYYDGTTYLMNKNFTTNRIIDRHRWHGNVYASYGDDDDRCLAWMSTDAYSQTNVTGVTGSLSVEPFKFDDDYSGFPVDNNMLFDSSTFDTNNNWGNGTTQGNPVSAANSRYTAPQTGLYFFSTDLILQVTKNNTDPLVLTCNYGFKLYTGGGSLDATFDTTQTIEIPGGSGLNTYDFPLNHNVGMLVQNAYYVQVFIDVDWLTTGVGASDDTIQFTILADQTYAPRYIGTTFACIGTSTGGGIIKAGEPLEYLAETVNFDKHVPTDVWDDIKANRTKGIKFNGSNVPTKTGFIESITRNVFTGNAEFELRKKFGQ